MNGPRYVFVLYVSDNSPRNQEVERKLRTACDMHVADNYSLKTVNVATSCGTESCSTILATPTLVIESPGPSRRYVGELCDTDGNQLVQQLFTEESW